LLLRNLCFKITTSIERNTHCLMFGLKKKADHLIDEDSLRELIQQNKKVNIIDVRTPMEYRPEHINPCNNVDVRDKEFKNKIKYFEKDKSYILYCANGKRSNKARKIMNTIGFDDVRVLEGGLNKWLGPLKVK